MITPNLEAEQGDLILPVWQRLKAFVLSLPVEGGPGVRVVKSSMGRIVSFDATGSTWPWPFKPSLSHGVVKLATGLVEGFEATIDGDPIGGDADNAIEQPSLALAYGDADAASQTSWIVLQVTADAKGMLAAKEDGTLEDGLSVEVVHSAKVSNHQATAVTGSSGGAIGSAPLAMITWADEQPTRIIPIVHHNLNYARTFPDTGTPRHFFWGV